MDTMDLIVRTLKEMGIISVIVKKEKACFFT